MGGSTKKVDTTPAQTQQVRSGVVNYLNTGQGPQSQIMNTAQPGIVTAAPVNTQFSSGQNVDRSQIGNVSSTPTQSVDQLGGANSAFYNNMVSQLQPSFDQQNAKTAAAAKEASGNLTGSGFANILGNALNSNLNTQQATLANYASQGINTEVQRQEQGAAQNLSAQQANQSADTNFMNALLTRNQQGLAAQQMGLSAAQGNQQTAQQANNLQYSTQAQTANQNAANYLQLLGSQSTAGVAPSTIQQSGGIGSILSPIASIAGQAAGAGKLFGI